MQSPVMQERLCLHLAVAELMANKKFTSRSVGRPLTTTQPQDDTLDFPVSVSDVTFPIHPLSQRSAAILFGMTGQVLLLHGLWHLA
jgi:hypothetical protein